MLLYFYGKHLLLLFALILTVHIILIYRIIAGGDVEYLFFIYILELVDVG